MHWHEPISRPRPTASADREVTITLAQAQELGETTRGEGDAMRTRIFAQAYGREWDIHKKAVLGRVYWELTGEDIDLRQRMLSD